MSYLSFEFASKPGSEHVFTLATLMNDWIKKFKEAGKGTPDVAYIWADHMTLTLKRDSLAPIETIKVSCPFFKGKCTLPVPPLLIDIVKHNVKVGEKITIVGTTDNEKSTAIDATLISTSQNGAGRKSRHRKRKSRSYRKSRRHTNRR